MLFHCRSCRQDKQSSDFGKHKGTKTGLEPKCKSCRALAAKERYRADPSKVYETNRKWLNKNKDHNRKYHREWHRRKAEGDETFYLNKTMRHRMWKSLSGQSSWSVAQDILGYTIDDLRCHLENQFTAGMSWSNKGQWHIDHIIPLHSFGQMKFGDSYFKKAWALSNLRPLWAKDNLSKGRKICEAITIPLQPR